MTKLSKHFEPSKNDQKSGARLSKEFKASRDEQKSETLPWKEIERSKDEQKSSTKVLQLFKDEHTSRVSLSNELETSKDEQKLRGPSSKDFEASKGEQAGTVELSEQIGLQKSSSGVEPTPLRTGPGVLTRRCSVVLERSKPYALRTIGRQRSQKDSPTSNTRLTKAQKRLL